MSIYLKPLEEQVVVLTGASSGIGLTTARALASHGARLVLVSRNAAELGRLAAELNNDFGGKRAAVAPADVGNLEEVEQVAEIAIEAFGSFDTWINNAGVAIYGQILDVPLKDHRRLFDTNYFGVVNGSIVAARHLRDHGGKIVNIGSVLSDRAVNFQGPYSASKHAVKGFTDALRMELEEAGAPVSVTLIKPSAIDTSYMEHARSYLDSPGTRNPPPSYDPALVAKAILFACEHNRRSIVVGFGGWAIAMMGAHAPRLTDHIMEAVGRPLQTSEEPGRRALRDNLYGARQDGSERSSMPGLPARKTSLLLEAQLHPVAAMVALGGLGLLAAQLLRASRKD